MLRLEFPEALTHDLLLSAASYAYFWACVLSLALFLQTDLACSSGRVVRVAGCLAPTAALLVGQPWIAYSPTQPFGVGVCSMCFMGALTMVWWSLQPLSNKRRPSIMEVCASVVTHPMAGVIEVHKRAQRRKAAAAAAAAGNDDDTATTVKSSSDRQPLVVHVDACGDLRTPAAAAAAAAPARPSLRAALLSALASVLLTAVCYDAGLHLLCSVSNGLCSAGTSASSSLARAVFGYAAGLLLPLQMEVMFGCLRASLIGGGLLVPALGEYAQQLPVRAFNRPYACQSITELWSWRWHGFLRFYFEHLAMPAADRLLPKAVVAHGRVRAAVHTVSAFLLSALVHEYLTWAAFGSVTGQYFLFFMLHCAAVLLEGWGERVMKKLVVRQRRIMQQRGASGVAYERASQDATDTSSQGQGQGAAPAAQVVVPRWAMHVWATLVSVTLAPLFIEPFRAAVYFAERAWHPFGVAVTPRVLGWASAQLHAPLTCAEVVAVL